MNALNSRLIMAALAGAVVLFVSDYLAYDLLLAGFFEANSSAPAGAGETPDRLWLAVAQLAYGVLLATVLAWKRAANAADGARAGAVLGVLIGLAKNFSMLATTATLNMTSTLVDSVVHGVLMGVAGAVVGTMLGRSAQA